MTTNQLKYFVTAAEYLNFTKAGQAHYISQTAITQHIHALEEQLGVELFIREKRNIRLTPAGEVFLKEAKSILARTNAAVDKVKKAASGFSGSINIGYVKGQENTSIGTLMKNFYQQYPTVSFQLFRESHLDLISYVDRGILDVAINICYANTELHDLQSICIDKQRLYAVLYPSHPYAQLSSIRRYDLRKDDFFLTKYFETNSAKDYENFIPDKFAEAGFIPHVIGVSSDIETLMILVATGLGITILPEAAIKYVKQSNELVFIPLEGESEIIDVVALWKGSNSNPVLQLFLEMLKSAPDIP
ncbi:MAG: LysR family transcriptional regulator [Clostridiales bacterium]|nr:LysR family transcriptional regulator [Clostridiales bacterium]